MRTLLVAVAVIAPADWSDEDVMDALRWKTDVPGIDGAYCDYQSGFENVRIRTMHLKESSE